MDEETIKRLYELYLQHHMYYNILKDIYSLSEFKTFFIEGLSIDNRMVNYNFHQVIQGYFNTFEYKFDDDMRIKLSQLLDNDDVANHHIAFELIYKQFKNT